MTEEEISVKMDEEEFAERVWRRVSYTFAYIALTLFFTGLFSYTLTQIPSNVVAMVLAMSSCAGLFAWICAKNEQQNAQNQRVLDWDYFNNNTEDEDELNDLRSDVWDLKRQIQEKNQMIRQLTEPVQTVRVRSITALAALPR